MLEMKKGHGKTNIAVASNHYGFGEWISRHGSMVKRDIIFDRCGKAAFAKMEIVYLDSGTNGIHAIPFVVVLSVIRGLVFLPVLPQPHLSLWYTIPVCVL